MVIKNHQVLVNTYQLGCTPKHEPTTKLLGRRYDGNYLAQQSAESSSVELSMKQEGTPPTLVM